jgi:hypothetical protein
MSRGVDRDSQMIWYIMCMDARLGIPFLVTGKRQIVYRAFITRMQPWNVTNRMIVGHRAGGRSLPEQHLLLRVCSLYNTKCVNLQSTHL